MFILSMAKVSNNEVNILYVGVFPVSRKHQPQTALNTS